MAQHAASFYRLCVALTKRLLAATGFTVIKNNNALKITMLQRNCQLMRTGLLATPARTCCPHILELS